MKKLLIFTDIGVDDSFALMYALLHPELDVVGIVTEYGNISQQQAMQNAAYLLKVANRNDIPIIGGAQHPLSGEHPKSYPNIHGVHGLGDLVPPKTFDKDLNNFNLIFELIESYPNELIIVNFSRLTSLAMGFILSYSTMKLVKRYYIMGGAFLIPGNVTALAEVNFYSDPIAADIVMSMAHDIYLYPLNVTHYALINELNIKYLYEQNANCFASIIPSIYSFYFNAYKKDYPMIQGAPMHDLVSISGVTNLSICQYVQKPVTIQQDGEAKGVSIADFRPWIEPDSDANTKIAVTLDYELFQRNFLNSMLTPLNN
ncbi:nucleoside hydrolase [Bacillus solimangrovi]|uniref:Inosine/uridine-preferring nucleoside hydrolase domain-containing protein n=1 Tax=Bacillus solimangrovi TaxID=1305675 RepID=A0A1E5LC25_9BACI|nr:nucleoside hydrolase [Bacillus solimangrovi]OEH91634.1 hypothetical protein BFG57_04490 [Bacillus solimangrovi]